MTKGKVVFISIVLVVLTMSFGCVSTRPSMSFDPVNWQTECGAFVQALTDLAPNAVREKNNTSSEQFIGKEVTWELNFIAVEKGKDGKDSLRFYLEPAGIKYQFFTGKPVMMTFSPAANTWDSWKAIKPGSRVKINGRVANIMYVTMTPSDNPSKNTPVAIPSIENVKLAASTVTDDPATKTDRTLQDIIRQENTKACIETDQDAKATQQFIRTFPLVKGANLNEQIAQNPRAKDLVKKIDEIVASATNMSKLELTTRIDTMLHKEGFLSADNPANFSIGLKYSAANSKILGVDGLIATWSRKSVTTGKTGSLNGHALVVNKVEKTFSMDGFSVSWAAMEEEIFKGGNRAEFDLTKQGFVAYYTFKNCGRLEAENIHKEVINKIVELHR